jgi:transposase
MEQQELIAGEAAEVVEQRRAALREQRAILHQTAPPRVVEARRDQLEMQPVDLDALLPAEHRARGVWRLVERLDLSRFYDPIKARGSTAGRARTDPKVLLALWLYATADGVVHARELERLCRQHTVYRWLRGGVPVNYHTLSDFRTAHGAALNELLTQVLGVLLHAGLLELKRVTQDGTRVRASAGSRAFRRRAKLKECLAAARAQVAALAAQAKTPAAATASPRQQAARQRAVREREQRVDRALAALEAVQHDRAASKKGRNDPTTPPRGSTTDPDARKLRMGDGGYRPAYNTQFATDTASGVIVGVAVSQSRTDFGEAVPMLAQVRKRTERQPEEWLVDSGFTSREAVDDLSAMGVTVYGALPQRKEKPDPYAPQRRDSAAMAELKTRMRSEAGQAIYRERAAVAERVNADLKTWRGLTQFVVRGKNKIVCIALWNVLAFNLLRWLSLTSGTQA